MVPASLSASFLQTMLSQMFSARIALMREKIKQIEAFKPCLLDFLAH